MGRFSLKPIRPGEYSAYLTLYLAIAPGERSLPGASNPSIFSNCNCLVIAWIFALTAVDVWTLHSHSSSYPLFPTHFSCIDLLNWICSWMHCGRQVVPLQYTSNFCSNYCQKLWHCALLVFSKCFRAGYFTFSQLKFEVNKGINL